MADDALEEIADQNKFSGGRKDGRGAKQSVARKLFGPKRPKISTLQARSLAATRKREKQS